MVCWFRAVALVCLIVLGSSCQGKKGGSGYRIGFDRSWYPVEIAGQEKNLLAFSLELLVEIAKEENLQIAVQNRNWDNLLPGLQDRQYDAMLSTMQPYSFNLKEYTFSDPYLLTGPVLVVPKDSKIQDTHQLKGKEVGVVHGSSAALFLQTVPGIILKGYGATAQVLEGLSKGDINAAAVEVLMAQKYVQNLYQDDFKIIGAPLGNEGIRLITLHPQDPKLVKKFDRGLKRLKKTGAYDKLLEKWGLAPDGKPIANLSEKAHRFLSLFSF